MLFTCHTYEIFVPLKKGVQYECILSLLQGLVCSSFVRQSLSINSFSIAVVFSPRVPPLIILAYRSSHSVPPSWYFLRGLRGLRVDLNLTVAARSDNHYKDCKNAR